MFDTKRIAEVLLSLNSLLLIVSAPDDAASIFPPTKVKPSIVTSKGVAELRIEKMTGCELASMVTPAADGPMIVRESVILIEDPESAIVSSTPSAKTPNVSSNVIVSWPLSLFASMIASRNDKFP